jgi:hypothetical protein
MKVFILYEVQWDTHDEHRRVIDVYLHRVEVDRERERMMDEYSYTDADHGQDYEIEERDLK